MRKTIFLNLVVVLLAAGSVPAGSQAIPERYAPNEIVVKFHEPIADNIEKQLEVKGMTNELKLSKKLDELNRRYRVKKIKPLFKNFKKNRRRIKTLLKKDKALLTKREKRILRRLKRAPKNVRVPDLGRIYKIEVQPKPGQSLEKVVAAYNSNPDVEYAELNYIVSVNLTPNDPRYSIQWSLNNTGQQYPPDNYSGTPDCDIDAPEAWDIYTGSSEVLVAVVDTGVDYNHRDLQSNMWTDSNGCYGYDFINDDNDPMDDNGHGTHCAGIIAADGNNGVDITGVCWNAKIMGLKFLGSDGYGDSSDAASAFYYAVENGADIISNSWGGGGYSETLKQAIDYAHSQGVIMVASAGNDDSDEAHYPAYYDHVIAVASTDSDDQKASSSNYGDWVDIAAPGVDVLSLRANGTSEGTPYGTYTTVMSGTSMACPHVSGACALLLSANETLSSTEIYDILMASVDPIAPDICISNGRLNILSAMLAAFPSKGYVSLGRDYYSCSDEITIGLTDYDLAGQGNHEVILSTNGGDSETIVLTETTPTLGVFSGAILTVSGDPNTENNTLQVAHDEIITATYEDANDGTGSPATATDTATVDCQPSTIFNVQVSKPGPEPTVIFETNEPTTSRILCGLACGGPYIIEGNNWNLATTHTIKLTVASPETDYFFIVKATDAAGNETTDSNNGQCYTFTTVGYDIYIPSQYPTIQEAIDVSWEGGTVWVADGTYTGDGNRDIDFQGKAITVRSENGPNSCIIDCNGTEVEPHRGFYFHNAEDANSILDGFTITNGYQEYGGGIYCTRGLRGTEVVGSDPKILNCVIKDNSASYQGGGMLNESSAPMLLNCTFSQNQTLLPFSYYYGGGGMFNMDSSPTLINCDFSNNSADADGAYGGGMYNISSDPILRNCEFTNNSCGHIGGGMANQPSDWGIKGSAILDNCIFSGNSALFAGGIGNEDCALTLNNCTFNGNVGRSEVGGVGGVYFYSPADVITFTNSIFWGNSDSGGTDESAQIEFEIGEPNVNYSCIQGWTGTLGGTGNIGTDPCFVAPGHWEDPCNTPADVNDDLWIEGDFHLQSAAGRWDPNVNSWVTDANMSRCIDAGDPNSDWTAELWSHGKHINMGAFGGTPQASMSLSDAGNIADLNNNDLVDYTDLKLLVEWWLSQELLLPEDLNRDGIVNFADFGIFADNWLWEQ